MLSDQQKLLVEKIGLVYEAEGLSPAVSRVLGLLFVSDKPELTFDEVRETLQLSKSATSNALNIAIKLNRVEYITKPGDRKRYFKSNLALWRDNFMEHYKKKQCWASLMREVMEQRPKDTKEFNMAMKEFVNFIEYMGEEVPKLYKNWENKTK